MHNELKDWLETRHAFFMWAIDQVDDVNAGVARAERFSDLSTALAGHLRSTARGTNRALHRVASAQESEHMLQKYEAVASALADALNARASGRNFMSAFHGLADAVADMCQAERTVLLPLLGERFAHAALTLVAVQMEQSFDEYVGIVGLDGLPTHAVEPAERFFDPAEATQPDVRQRRLPN